MVSHSAVHYQMALQSINLAGLAFGRHESIVRSLTVGQRKPVRAMVWNYFVGDIHLTPSDKKIRNCVGELVEEQRLPIDL